MREDLEPDVSPEAFSEEAIGSLEAYDIQVADDVAWDEEGYELVADPNNDDDAEISL